MPYYRRRYRGYYPRRWRYRFWRPRKTLYRRRWRRRRRVRFQKKMPSIRLKMYQPPSIKRLKVKGTYPLFYCTHDRLTNNMNMWLDSIAPRYIPSGGGFSISAFSLRTLYNEHLRLNNWWTHTNDNYPLIRFTGCTLKLYSSLNVDYVFSYQNYYPMRASELMFHSTHPAVQLLNNRKRVMICKQGNNKNRKPYRKIKIRPPAQMQNKWYFQRDIVDVPLVLTTATAASLDRMLLHSFAPSTTIGFTSLNTTFFKNHNFMQETTAYRPQDNIHLFAVENGATEINKIKFGDIIYLANTMTFQKGIRINQQQAEATDNDQTKISKYFQTRTSWGNPFHADYLSGDKRMIITNLSIENIKTKYTNLTDMLNKNNTTDFQFKEEPNLIECRYNPIPDTGTENEIYLLKITEKTNIYDWNPHVPPQVIAKNLPLWTLAWGYLDWQKKLAEFQEIDTKCILVILSHQINPKTLPYYVPLDSTFLNNTSPYRPQYDITPADRANWHPKVLFQLKSINNIGASGPATAKLPKDISCEAHMSYTFHFKLGGSPAPMSTLTNPGEQPKYPTPDNLLRTTSLQNPALPFEHLLYHFDERRGQITDKAAKRLQKYAKTEKTILPITGSTTELPAPYKSPQTSETSTSEEEKTPEEQLQQQLLEQKLLRKRIQQLLKKMSNFE
nr:MAG: ORF1 [TTV-like mini virus]